LYPFVELPFKIVRIGVKFRKIQLVERYDFRVIRHQRVFCDVLRFHMDSCLFYGKVTTKQLCFLRIISQKKNSRALYLTAFIPSGSASRKAIKSASSLVLNNS